MNKFLIFVLIGLFVMGLVFTSGCTNSQPDSPSDGGEDSGQQPQPESPSGDDYVIPAPPIPGGN